jgi:hypothetical protein
LQHQIYSKWKACGFIRFKKDNSLKNEVDELTSNENSQEIDDMR